MGSSNQTNLPIKKASFGHQILQHLKRKWNKKLGKVQEIPWMAQKERDILEEALVRLNPSKCLEWGSGFSTLTFPKLLSQNIEWSSIEHDDAWHKAISARELPQQVTLDHVGAGNPPPYEETDGGYGDFKKYIEHPKDQYDFILIDGRARNHCLKRAYDLISNNGLVVMHDANRPSYLENTSLFEHQYLFTDHRKTFGGLWIGSKSSTIDTFINLNHHQALWDAHFNLLRVIRPFAKR